MLLTLNFKTPNNTGAPNYNICGQAASVLGFLNTSCQVQVNGVDILNTINLSTAVVVTGVPIGTTGFTLTSFTKNNGTGTLTFGIDGINVWEEADFTIRINKSAYRKYENTFKMFGYDIGTGLTPGNPLMNIYLVADANNLDVDGFQSKAFSNIISYRKPFTDKVYIYNMVGTDGTISYNNAITGDNIGGGQSAVVCSITGLDIIQTISVSNKYCQITDICTSTISNIKSIWHPPVNKNTYSNLNCNSECISNKDQQSIELNFQYDDVSLYNINGDSVWIFSPDSPSDTLYQQVVFEVYDYNGALIDTLNIDVTEYYSAYLSNPSIIIPTVFNFLASTFGAILVKIKYQILIIDQDSDSTNDVILVECIKLQTYNACNFWKVENDEVCGSYKVSNCSLLNGTLNVMEMQEDKTFISIYEDDLNSLQTLNIALENDGVYQFILTYQDEEGEDKTEIFNITNYCAFKACYFEFLKKVMCNDLCENCNKTNFYDFNSFSLNAQTFLALLNNEFSFNYLYTSIDTRKIEELYSIKQFIERISEYCSKSCKCSTC